MSERTPIAPDVRRKILRLRFVTIALLLWMVVIVVRLFSIQLIDHTTYEQMAKRQYERRVTIEAERGIVYDRNMNKLVVNLMNTSFAADPSLMSADDKKTVAVQFASLFDRKTTDYQKLLDKKTAFVWLERKVGPSVAEKINDSIKGLIKLQSLRRQYPYGFSAAQLIGFTDVDQKGLSGLERDVDADLAGRHGWAILQADALGRLSPSPEYPHDDPVQGNHVVLTIDAHYQSLAYSELSRTVEDYGADDGLVIIMSPNSGEILAMAHAPSFDPASPEKTPPALFRNRAITDMYEPGSTFKAFTAAAALEEGLVTPQELINCENGVIKMYGHRIHDTKKHGLLTLTQVVEKSSNIGTIKIAQRLGPDRLFQYVRAFGFGTETGVDLDGEVAGTLALPTDWSGLSLPMISIGQEVGVTALQLANAYCAIANGGTLMRPYVIRSVLSPDGTIVRQTEPRAIRTVASRETMGKISRMLYDVVEAGTGKRAAIRGVRMAGKTGTAQKIEKGKYSEDKFTASFVGFFPADQPQLVFLVIVNNPRKSIWGETSAATTARAIVEKIINSNDDVARRIHRALAESENDRPAALDVPNLVYMNVDAARGVLDRLNMNYDVVGDGDWVASQEWSGDAGKRHVRLIASTQILAEEIGEPNLSRDVSSRMVPDVRGLSIRTAINKLHAEGIDVKVKGSGFVVNQFPAPGARLPHGAVCVIQCRISM